MFKSMKIEHWKSIPRFPGYQVSSLGRVKSLERRVLTKGGGTRVAPERILKIKIDRYGYRVACLYREGRKKYPGVARLVATTFLPNPEGLPQVDHLDHSKDNDVVENLRWVSAATNSRRRRNSKLNMEKAGEIRRLFATGEFSQPQLAEQFGIRQQAVSRVVLFKQWNPEVL